MTSKRVLAAIRLSKDTDESTSVEGQREAIRRWAGQNGHLVTLEAVDTDVSGATPSLARPRLAALLASPAAFDIVAGIKIDRLSRDTEDFLSFARWLNARGKWLVSTGENVTLRGDGSASDVMTATVLAAAATMERQRIAERCRDSRERLASAGRFAGGTPPFGYAVKDTGKGKTLVQNPATASVARRMADMAIGGASNGKIARWLNAEGVRTGRGCEWTDEVVRKVLLGNALAGYATRRGNRVRTTDGRDVTITDEPILDDDQWARLQAALASRRQKRAERVGGHMLLRVIYCWGCSTPEKPWPMYGHLSQGRNKASIYRCQKCGYSLGMARAEKAVEDHILHYESELIPERVVIPAVSHTAELARTEARIADIESQVVSGAMPAASASRMLTALEAERERLAALPQRDERIVYEPTTRTVSEEWEALDTQGRGQWLRHWGIRTFERRGGGYTRSLELTAAILAAMGRTKDEYALV